MTWHSTQRWPLSEQAYAFENRADAIVQCSLEILLETRFLVIVKPHAFRPLGLICLRDHKQCSSAQYFMRTGINDIQRVIPQNFESAIIFFKD